MSQPQQPGKPGGGGDIVWSIIGTLVAGVLAWGGIGWLLDRWLGTEFLVAVGILVGAAGAFYLIIRRYGGG
jgi:F0F1-type ATP synthase assembly protein I